MITAAAQLLSKRASTTSTKYVYQGIRSESMLSVDARVAKHDQDRERGFSMVIGSDETPVLPYVRPLPMAPTDQTPTLGQA